MALFSGLRSSALTALFGYLVFGRFADRRGNTTLLVLTGFLIPVLPALWVFVTSPYQVFPINAASGFLWAGYTLASFNYLLEASPQEDRESAAALYQAAVATSAVLGPLLGGHLVRVIGYVPVFVLSGAGRLAGTVIFLLSVRLIRPAGPLATLPGSPR